MDVAFQDDVSCGHARGARDADADHGQTGVELDGVADRFLDVRRAAHEKALDSGLEHGDRGFEVAAGIDHLYLFVEGGSEYTITRCFCQYQMDKQRYRLFRQNVVVLKAYDSVHQFAFAKKRSIYAYKKRSCRHLHLWTNGLRLCINRELAYVCARRYGGSAIDGRWFEG